MKILRNSETYELNENISQIIFTFLKLNKKTNKQNSLFLIKHAYMKKFYPHIEIYFYYFKRHFVVDSVIAFEAPFNLNKTFCLLEK